MKRTALATVLVLSGCASIPDSSQELVGGAAIKQTNCYAQDHDQVSGKVKTFLERCYRVQTVLIPIAGVPVPMTSSYQVVEEHSGQNRRYSVRSKYGFGLTFDIKQNTGNCPTQVDMYALRSHLREKFDRVDAAINDKNPGCGMI